jgi:hypothetical protein
VAGAMTVSAAQQHANSTERRSVDGRKMMAPLVSPSELSGG